MRTNRRRTFLVSITMLVVLVVSAAPSHASSEDLRFGISRAPSSGLNGKACVTTGQIWVQELGDSGINRLKAQFKRKSPQQLRYYEPIPSHQTTKWAYSATFRRDSRSYYQYFNIGLRYPAGGRYALWTRVVGERPGLWRPDRAISYRLGEIGCEGGVGF